MVHGDDFVIVARKAGRQKILNLLTDHFEHKHETAGPGPDMAKQIRIYFFKSMTEYESEFSYQTCVL